MCFLKQFRSVQELKFFSAFSEKFLKNKIKSKTIAIKKSIKKQTNKNKNDFFEVKKKKIKKKSKTRMTANVLKQDPNT